MGTLSTADKKTQTLALSLLFGGALCLFTSPLTASLGSAFFFYSLAAKHKITRQNELDEDIDALDIREDLRVGAVLGYLKDNKFELSEGLANFTFTKTSEKIQKRKVPSERLTLVEQILTNNPYLNVIRFLKNNGVNLNMRSRDSNGLLFIKDILVNEKLVQLLIDNGCDVNFKGTDNYTPLMLAVWQNQPYTAQLLLNNGADPTITTTRNEKAVNFLEKITDPSEKEHLRKRLKIN